MLLYQDPRAPNPRRVRMFLAEKGVTVSTIDVTIASGAHQSPDYLAKHPLGLLPVLEFADGRILRESVAICRYIEELHPEPNLFGRDPWERAQIEQWNRHAELELLFPISQAFRNVHPFWKDKIRQAPDFGAEMKLLAERRLAWFDGELGNRAWIAGDRFTIADITALCAIDFGKLADVRVTPEVWPNLARWYAIVRARPSASA